MVMMIHGPDFQGASSRRSVYSASVIRDKLREIKRGPRAQCPTCSRDCAVYWPKGGDGTVRITVWHKRSPEKWCRAEVDVEGIRYTR